LRLGRGVPLLLAFVASAGLFARPASAVEPCRTIATAAGEVHEWSAPLDRRLSLDERDLSLRGALEQIASSARFRLSYSSEYLPLDRRVCLRVQDASAGSVLAALLRGTVLEAVVTGPDQIVLAPTRVARERFERPLDVLDRVLVTGSATREKVRSTPVAIDVIAVPKLESHDEVRLDRTLDETVPGIWLWEQSPTSVLSRYGSIRGASSFGVSYPKIYIDGIEVANPLLITELGLGSVSHVEVIRGPQGAALYGADAISGVINVVSRHDGVGADGRRMQLRSRIGVAESDFVSACAKSSSPQCTGNVLGQEHTLSLRTGTQTRSAGASATYTTLGNYLPNGYSRRLSMNADARQIGSRATFTATARLFAQETGAPGNPLLSGTYPLPDDSSTVGGGAGITQQSVTQYTLGAAATIASQSRWTHRLVAGLDGYRLDDVAGGGLLPSASDSALRAARGGADRLTFRASSSTQVGVPSLVAATITLSAELAALREASDDAARNAAAPFFDPVTWRHNEGLVAQSVLSVRDALFVSGGLRLERSSGYGALPQTSMLPMAGAAYVADAGAHTVKVRAAYGKGIRPARTSLRPTWMINRPLAKLEHLGHETQSGVEVGADLFIGGMFTVNLTRFDQRASGLVQSVGVADPHASAASQWQGGRTDVLPATYQLQNVGEISNRGWEVQGTASMRSMTLSGTLSLVTSRVARVTDGYSGELRVGDRMLEVPARTMSFSATWTEPRWQAALGISRASDWINYDRARLFADVASSPNGPGEFVGPRLREYWRAYDGVTRVRATMSRALFADLAAVVTGENLLGAQRGEPDDVTIVPGRMMSAGVRVKF
jgi:iron complex outermembrane recepter protein